MSFDLADTNPGPLLTVIPFSFYPEDEWQSDLELGATELAIAVASGGAPSGLPHTDPHFYLVKAAHWASAYMSSPFDASDTLNLYDVSGLAHYELAGAIDQAGAPSDLETTRAALVADLRKAVDGALAQGATDPFGFGFPWDTWDTTSHGAGLSVMASEVNELTGTQTYPTQSGRWLANILGANAWGVSLIVGDGTTFPPLPPAPGREHRRLPRRDGADPRRRGRRGSEPNALPRQPLRHARVPDRRTRRVRGVQQHREVQGRRRVVLDRRAGHRPERDVATRVRQTDGGPHMRSGGTR
jgi:hypothetical protein